MSQEMISRLQRTLFGVCFRHPPFNDEKPTTYRGAPRPKFRASHRKKNLLAKHVRYPIGWGISNRVNRRRRNVLSFGPFFLRNIHEKPEKKLWERIFLVVAHNGFFEFVLV